MVGHIKLHSLKTKKNGKVGNTQTDHHSSFNNKEYSKDFSRLKKINILVFVFVLFSPVDFKVDLFSSSYDKTHRSTSITTTFGTTVLFRPYAHI